MKYPGVELSQGGTIRGGIVWVELSGWNYPDLVWGESIQGGIVQEEQSWDELFRWNGPGWNHGVELSVVEMSGNPLKVTLFTYG